MMAAGVKYDDASWHSDGDFPADLPAEAAATHVGMYLAWAVLRGLSSPTTEAHKSDLVSRKLSPGEFCRRECDGSVTDEDLSQKGNRFTAWYYDIEKCIYYKDLEEEFGQSANNSLYHIKDDWDSFEKIAKRIDVRLHDFLLSQPQGN